MRSLIFIALIMLSFSSTAQGVDRSAIAKCASLSGDLERLECFDQLAKEYGLAEAATTSLATSDTGNWQVSEKINPIDDSKTVVLRLTASTGHNNFGRKVSFIARCTSGETEAYINWQDYLGSKADVLTRIGSAKATRKRWSLSTDSKATFSPTPRELLSSMSETTKFIAQVTPYNENPVTAIFNTAGLEAALKPLRETCAW